MKLAIKSLEGRATGEIELDDRIFALEARSDILHRMVMYQLARRRCGSRKTKTRGEIRASGRKISRQKGTGRARHGSVSANVFRGGAKAHGPVVRSHSIQLPRKVRQLALKHALSARADNLVVLENIFLAEPRTSLLRKHLSLDGRILVVDGERVDKNFFLAARNHPRVDVLPLQGINVYDVLRCNRLVLTRAAVAGLHKRFLG